MNKTISPVEFIRRVIKKSELGKHFKLMPFQGDFAFGKRLAPLIVAALTFLTFLPVLWNEFLTIFDDNINLVFNDQYRGLGWTQLKWMFTTLYNGHYRPLTWVTFGLDYLIWEMNPAGYHLTSLLIHVANAVLFYFVARRLLALALPGSNDLTLGAGFAALLFSLHPMRVEAVALASDRKELLATFFFCGRSPFT